jgi:hypothetical protein
MRPISDHLDAVNELLPALHDGFFVERYDGSGEQLVVLGTSELSCRRDLVVTCLAPLEVSFEPCFHADTVALRTNDAGQAILEFFEEGRVALLVRGGTFCFESSLI